MNRSAKVYTFDSFRLDAAERRLWRDGESIPLTPKAFDMLLMLVQHSGRIMEKDALMQALWPDSIVEESNLTQTIYVLRKVLGEDPNGLKFIETVPKRGYRFVAPVGEMVEEEPALIVERHTRSRIVIEQEEEKSEDRVPSVEDRDGESPVSPPQPRSARRRRWLWLIAAPMLLLGGMLWLYVSGFHARGSMPPMKTSPLTSLKGVEIAPTFSPDGNQVAFMWFGETNDKADIYVKMVGTETMLRLTYDPAHDVSPAWSPDGRQIAFIRNSKNEHIIYTIPALGGTERKLYTARIPVCLRWTPDGKYLAFSEATATEPRRIHLLSLDSLETRILTTMSEPAGADIYFAFSPQGTTLAFARFMSQGVADIYLVPMAGGEPRRLTFDNQAIFGLDWSQDSQSIIFSSARGGDYRLWKVPASGGEPEMLFAGGEGVYFPAISPQGHRLAYMQQQFEDTNIWRVDISEPTNPASQPTQLAFSTRWEEGPQFSPDGQKFTYISLRSGSREVWVCNRDGSDPYKVTSMGGQHTSTPRWSPDGQQIAFDSRPEGYADIYIIDVKGSVPRRLTSDPHSDEIPSWSRDGQWIYFRSKRTGTWQIWKIPAAGGDALQVTTNGGMMAFESPDGQNLYFVKPQTSGIWQIPVTGGDETVLVNHLKPQFWGFWTVSDHGIYLVGEDSFDHPVIEFYDFATRRVAQVTTLDKTKWMGMGASGFTVSPDGKTILYVQQDGNEGDIILVDNFR